MSDVFSKEQIQTVSILSENFSRLCSVVISAKCHCKANVRTVSVNQLSYEEFIRSAPSPSAYGVINCKSINSNWLLEINPAVSLSMLNAMLGGLPEPPTGIDPQRELTDIEQAVMKKLIVRLLESLRKAWLPISDIDPDLTKFETLPQFVHLVPANEIILLITHEVKIGETEGNINLCIPYSSVKELGGI